MNNADWPEMSPWYSHGSLTSGKERERSERGRRSKAAKVDRRKDFADPLVAMQSFLKQKKQAEVQRVTMECSAHDDDNRDAKRCGRRRRERAKGSRDEREQRKRKRDRESNGKDGEQAYEYIHSEKSGELLNSRRLDRRTGRGHYFAVDPGEKEL